jgi:hypothetical protein
MTDKEKEQSSEKPQSKSEVKAEIKRLMEKLAKQEAQRRSGARELTPKARMLDASALEKKDPEHYYRYENTDEAGRMQIQIDEGFVAVPEKECEEAGVRASIGELRLIRQPMEKHEETVQRAKELNESRLRAHKTEVREAVAAVAKELRDRYGLDVSVDRLLVDE